MSWLVAVTAGVAAGLVFFGGLWLTLRLSLSAGRWRPLLAGSFVIRLALVGLVFVALSQEGAGYVLAGLAGLLLARHSLLGRIGGIGHGR